MTVWECKFKKCGDGTGCIEVWRIDTKKLPEDLKKEDRPESFENEFEKFEIVKKRDKETNDTGNIEIKTFEYAKHSRLIFRIYLKRQKSAQTNAERLEVEANYIENNEEVMCGEITSDVLALKEELQNLKGYGVVLPRSVYNEIHKCVEDNYLDLKVFEAEFIGNILSDKIINDIFIEYCKYIREEKIQPITVSNKELYVIDVNTFGEIFEEMRYSHFNIKDVKNRFIGKYTYSNNIGGSYTVPEKDDKKSYKAIAFYGKIVDDEMEEIAVLTWAGLHHEDARLKPIDIMNLVDKYSDPMTVFKIVLDAISKSFGIEAASDYEDSEGESDDDDSGDNEKNE